jgi:hypothetical protein
LSPNNLGDAILRCPQGIQLKDEELFKKNSGSIWVFPCFLRHVLALHFAGGITALRSSSHA